jgi:subtilase family serine protease
MINKISIRNHPSRALPLVAFALALSACGDNSGGIAASGSQAASGPAQSLVMTLPTAGQSDALVATPQFHMAPVVLDVPTDADVEDPAGSALTAPHTQFVTAELAQLSTRRLTPAAMESVLREGIVPSESSAYASDATPLASGTAVATYTPAQIRAAYGLPALPAAGTTLTSAQAAQLGAGQTIYLIDTYDDPNAAAELAAFNQQFALPTCTVTPIATNASLPLPVAGKSGCSFSVVYVNAAGSMTSTSPGYNSGWATEIALDVQWAHATAPLARIILLEASPQSLNTQMQAVALANAMGPGVVSMSFGAPEGGYTAGFDHLFQGTGMTYAAAAGDSGAGVEFPAVSSHVLAVGGSTLTYNGTLPRSEIVWSGTGGGVSQYTPKPSYQTSAVPDMGTQKFRSVSDVTFNADPNSGQYTAVLTPGSTRPVWYSIGGTSLATPQWAGILSVANALRAQSAEGPLGDVHAKLYGIASLPTPYASSFYDITMGSDGSCAVCFAAIGYDLPTGVGTPNVTSLLTALVDAPTPTAPVVVPASVSGTAGLALSFSVSVTASDAVSYALSNAPAGMSVNSAGLVSWAAPVLGTYAVTGIATDIVTGLSGQAVYTVSIAAGQPPIVQSASLSGTAGTAISYAVSVTHANPVQYGLSSSLSGMNISTAGVFSWLSPLAGTYAITVNAMDLKTGLTGKGVLSLTITAPKPPTVTAANVSATSGKPLSFTPTVLAVDPLSYSLSNAPSGMAIGNTGIVTWANPLKGVYAVTVTATDTKTGLSGTGISTVTVTQAGPVIAAAAIKGVAGKALTGSIGISDATSSTVSFTVSGVPAGAKLAASGASIVLSWASPVTGSYTLAVNAKDGNGVTAALNVPLTITAH